MSILSQPHFRNEAAALARLEQIVWPNGPRCPRCGGSERITPVKGGRSGLRRCGPCKREFTVTVGTIFERSHVKLHLWFQAAHLMASSKKGISAHQLHRTLQVTYKTAWLMKHRLLEAMREDHFVLGGEDKIVEIDQTFVGGKEKNKHASQREHLGSGGIGKEVVFSLIERGGVVRSHHVTQVTAKALRPILQAQVDGASTVMTDEGRATKKIGSEFAKHESVNHGTGEYVRGEADTNTIEAYFSILKRGIVEIYHHVSQRHLKRYLAEFDFRHNRRIALGINDVMRAESLVAGIVGKRLMYRDSPVG